MLAFPHALLAEPCQHLFRCKKQEEEISRLCGHIAREPERVHVLKSTLATTEAERQKLETKVNDLEQL